MNRPCSSNGKVSASRARGLGFKYRSDQIFTRDLKGVLEYNEDLIFLQ